MALLMQRAHGNGDVINSVELVKTMFSHMITVEPTTMPDGKEKILKFLIQRISLVNITRRINFQSFFKGVSNQHTSH